MAAPVIVATGEGGLTAAGTSVPVTLPGTLNSTSQYLILMSIGAAGTVNALTDWAEIIDENSAGGVKAFWFTGSGTPSNPTFTTTSTRSVWAAYEITGSARTFTPYVGTTATGTSTAPNGPSVTVTGGPKDILAFTWFGMSGTERADDDSIVTTFPTNYTLGQVEKTGGIGGSNIGGLLGAAARQVTGASSEDPGAFATVISAAWRCNTLIVEEVVVSDIVLHDATSSPAGAQGTGNLSWTHTPSGTPDAAVVMIAQANAPGDQVTTVTYGGEFMRRVRFAELDATEDGAVYIYFRQNPPSGAQTVAVTVSGSADKRASCTTLVATSGHLGIHDDDQVVNAAATNPAITLQLSEICWVGAVLVSGETAAATGIDADYTTIIEEDVVSISRNLIRKTVNATGATEVITWTYNNDETVGAAIAIRDDAAVLATFTPEARVSLPAGTTPLVRTNHKIGVRCRKVSGSGTVTLTAALYEGANNRSTNLTTSALTTSLATYELAISEANASNITDYSDLEIRWKADSSTGDAVNVEVADIWLEIPA